MKKEEKMEKTISQYGIMPKLEYFKSEVCELNEAITSYEELYEQFGLPDSNHIGNIAEKIENVMTLLEQFKTYYEISSEE